MTEKRYLLKWLEYESYYIDTKQEYVDEAELRFELDGYKTMSDEQVVSLLNENEQLKEQLILANGFIRMIENCYEDMTIEDILYEKYGEFQDELHLQMAIAKEEIE